MRKRIVELCEPCDCGSRVMHNNGGNYHEVIRLKKERKRNLVQFTDTCELTEEPPFEKISEAEADALLSEAKEKGWDIY